MILGSRQEHMNNIAQRRVLDLCSLPLTWCNLKVVLGYTWCWILAQVWLWITLD
jgi:hypothetical protein